MIFRIFPILLLLGTPSSLLAQGAPLPQQTTDELLKGLKEVATQLGAAKGKKTAAALEAYKLALTSNDKTHKLFEDCKKSVDFDAKGKSGGDWSDWKRSGEAKALGETPATTAMRLQLQWLVLTIQAADAETDTQCETVINQIPVFLEEMLGSWKKMEGYATLLRGSVVQSVFAEYFKLDQILKAPENWVSSPGNVDAIYEQTVLPYLREKKNLAGLQNSWTKRLAQVAQIVEIEYKEAKDEADDPGRGRIRIPGSKNFEERMLDFKQERYPSLQWAMMRDLFQAGSEASNGPAMLAHIKSHLGHPAADGWILELSALLKREPLPETEAPKAPVAGK
jgi:hypothetical protein